MQYLKADTSVKVVIGPVVAVGDGFTPVTTLSLSTADEAEIMKHDASAVTDISTNTFAAITSADGYYNLTLTTSQLDTEGMMTVLINDDSLCLPVRHDFMVVNANVYDSLFAAATTDYLQVDIAQAAGTAWASGAVTAASIAASALNGKGDWNVGKTGYSLTATTGLGNQTANITGNLSGSVGSVTGAVGSVTGNVGGNVVGSVGSLTNLTVQASTTLATGTHNPQTGDAFARLGAPAGASVSADIAAIEAQTDDIGTAGAGLTAVPWNASWDAEVQSEVDDALVARGLHYLVNTALPTNWATDVTANSAMDQMADNGTATFDRTTDSLQALRDRGDAAWTTATGFSTHAAADVWSVATRQLTSAQTFNLTGDITGNLSGSVGSVTGAVGSVTGNVGGNVTGSIGSLAAQAKTDVNTEVVDALNTDTYAEPGQGTPGATVTLAAKIGYIYKFLRNRITSTSTTISVFNDDATTVDHKSTHSDDGTTYDRGEFTTGP